MSPTALIDKMRELKEITEKKIRILKAFDADTLDDLPSIVKTRFVDNRIGTISFLEDKIQYYNKVIHIIETGEI